MQTCEASHPNCPKPKETILPKRVLELSPANSPTSLRLLITDRSWGTYACLSYCWGTTSQPLKLISSNLSALTNGISISILPRSIQDAIFTVRQLGLRYLWVDSLCIIQASDHAKSEEIKNMDRIYSNATMTISAANAEDCSHGFLANRDKWWSDDEGPPIRLPFLCPDWTVGNLTLVRYGAPGRHEPLYRRSWPFQEHLLSPRVLMYGSEQVLWVCQEDAPTGTGATFKDGGPAHDSSVTGLKYLRMFLHQRVVISRGFARRNLWIDMVREYSPRDQSIPDDKIHALRSIVSQYGRLMEDEYIAGLWKSWLLPGLVWKRAGQIRPRRKRQYPSWSWLSIDSGVVMEQANHEIYRSESLVGIQFVEFLPGLSGKQLDPFGPLPNAILYLRGCLVKVEAHVSKKINLLSDGSQGNRSMFLKPQPESIILDCQDTSLSESDGKDLDGTAWYLPVVRMQVVDTQTSRYIGYAVQGLLLVKGLGSEEFKRIGWFIGDVGDETRFLAGIKRDVYIR